MAGRLVDYMGSGLASALPAAATVHVALTTGAAGFYYATDTQTLYCLDRSGTPSWDMITVGGGWQLVKTYDFAVDGTVAQIDVNSTELGSWDRIMVVGRLNTSASDSLAIRLSNNNLATVFAGGTDYQLLSTTTGADNGGSSVIINTLTAVAGSKSFHFELSRFGDQIFGFNELTVSASARRFTAAAASGVNSFRLFPVGGTNIDGGKVNIMKLVL